MNRGFCGIGIYQPKHDTNVGTLFRSAHAFGADFIFTVGRQYRIQSSDTTKSFRHIPYWHFETINDLKSRIPKGSTLVNVEMSEKSRDLTTFCHPERAVYLLGNEVYGIPEKFLDGWTVHIPTEFCLNVATAGTCVLYDRCLKLK